MINRFFKPCTSNRGLFNNHRHFYTFTEEFLGGFITKVTARHPIKNSQDFFNVIPFGSHNEEILLFKITPTILAKVNTKIVTSNRIYYNKPVFSVLFDTHIASCIVTTSKDSIYFNERSFMSMGYDAKKFIYKQDAIFGDLIIINQNFIAEAAYKNLEKFKRIFYQISDNLTCPVFSYQNHIEKAAPVAKFLFKDNLNSFGV